MGGSGSKALHTAQMPSQILSSEIQNTAGPARGGQGLLCCHTLFLERSVSTPIRVSSLSSVFSLPGHSYDSPLKSAEAPLSMC